MDQSNILNTPIVSKTYEHVYATPELKLNETNSSGLEANRSNESKDGKQSYSLQSDKIKPKNKNRRSFTPAFLNHPLQTPEISPIEINHSLKSVNNNCNYNSINNDIDNIYTFLENSISSISPSFIEQTLNDSSNILIRPPKKSIIRRVFGADTSNGVSNSNKFDNKTIKYHSSKKMASSSKSILFTSTPCHTDDNINGSNLNNSDTLNFSGYDDSELINLADLHVTPKTTHNKCLTVPSILIELGLEKYIKNFQQKSVNSFTNLNDSDLIKCGIINENDRKNILNLMNFEMESPC